MIGVFDPVGLEELVERAGLMTRTDRKYVLPTSRTGAVLAGLVPHARALEIDGDREFGYASTYYDDDALTSFHLSAHGRRRRFKVRTRTYAATQQSFVEVKTRGVRGTTVKQRLPLSATASTWQDLPADALAFLQDALAPFGVRPDTLRPVLHTTYLRSTLFLPASAARVTLDTALSWTSSSGSALALPGLTVLETKSGAGASLADRHLWRHGTRPTRISKYGTGLSALEPTVRGNRWHPVVQRHFASPTPLLSDRTAA